jgi:hypothetical protein
MKAMIRKITDRIQNLFSKDVSTTVSSTGEDPVVEVFITGFTVFNHDKQKFDMEPVDKDFIRFRFLLIELEYNVLKEDPNWHFFLEGSYNLLRFSARFKERVEQILIRNEVVFVREELNGHMSARVWVDEQEATRAHQKHFMKIFHEYSVMAISIENYTTRKLTMLADRVIHCFFNHQLINFQKELDKNCNLEADITTHIAAERAFYVGTMVAYKKAYAQAREDVKKEYEERVSNMRDTLDKIEKIADVNAVEVEDLKLRVEELGAESKERTLQ